MRPISLKTNLLLYSGSPFHMSRYIVGRWRTVSRCVLRSSSPLVNIPFQHPFLQRCHKIGTKGCMSETADASAHQGLTKDQQWNRQSVQSSYQTTYIVSKSKVGICMCCSLVLGTRQTWCCLYLIRISLDFSKASLGCQNKQNCYLLFWGLKCSQMYDKSP